MATDFKPSWRPLRKSLRYLRDDLLQPGAAPGLDIDIYDGTQPDSPDDAVTTQTLLATVSIQDEDYAATDRAFGSVERSYPGVFMRMSDWGVVVTPETEAVTGTATWWRDETENIDGSAGTSSVDMVLDDDDINTRDNVTLSEFIIRYA